MRGATILEGPLLHFVVISIHAPNAGSDRQDAYRGHFDVDFNPRSPRGERPRHGSVLHDPRDFNPRSPCGERPLNFHRALSVRTFQPTLPMRGATNMFCDPALSMTISTHAPHAGSDNRGEDIERQANNFNPRSPCGERRIIAIGVCIATSFQPTLPMRGATADINKSASSILFI